jgi:hypothetical protein
MAGQYASNAWAEIIAKAAVSPLGVSALVVLVVGFVVLALIRREDKIGARLTIVVLLLVFCGGLLTAAFYNVRPAVTQPDASPATSATALPAPPAVAPSPPPRTASSRADCGTAWSGWIEVGGAVGNPCRFVARINSRAQSAPRSDIYVRRTYSGRPSSSMRFSEAAAMATSVVCRPPVRERSASPITRL